MGDPLSAFTVGDYERRSRAAAQLQQQSRGIFNHHAGQTLGGLGQALHSGRVGDLIKVKMPSISKEKTFRQELQEKVDRWLKKRG